MIEGAEYLTGSSYKPVTLVEGVTPSVTNWRNVNGRLAGSPLTLRADTRTLLGWSRRQKPDQMAAEQIQH